MLAEVSSDVDSLENQAIMTEAGQQGECGTVDLVGVAEQDRNVMRCVPHTATTCSMFASTDCFVNYLERNGAVKGVSGEKSPSKDTVTWPLFSDQTGWIPVALTRVAHAPELRYNLISISTLAEEGHTTRESREGLF